MIGQLLAKLIWPRCVLGCGQRVHPGALDRHLHVDHAGDLTGGAR